MTQLDLGSGTVQGLLAFLLNLEAKGRATKGAIAPMVSAVRLVFSKVGGADWQDIGVRSPDDVNIDDYMQRFANLTNGTYNKQSLFTYKARVGRAVRWYQSFLSDPGWTPSAKPTSQPAKKKAAPSTNLKKEMGQPVSAPPAPTPSDVPVSKAQLIAYPFPLASGQVISLYLPLRLPKSEAKRLAAFLDSIAFDNGEEEVKM